VYNATHCDSAGGAALRRRPLMLILFLVVVAVLVLVPAVEAQAKSWRIDSMDVVLDVQKNSSVWVEETVTFTFEGSYSFVGRVIPTDNLDSLTDIEVLQDGRPLPQGTTAGTWQTFTEGKSRIIQVNFALTDASATWVFRYRASGSVFFFDEGDELRWYVFDADTPVPINRVTATVKLPEAVPTEQMTMALGGAQLQCAGPWYGGVRRWTGPPLHQLLGGGGFPQGRRELPVDRQAGVGGHRPAGGLCAADCRVPGHAPALAQARAR